MRYLESLTDFFKSPRWMMNLLLATVCLLIPIVGPMVLHGWLIGGFWGRDDSDPATFPDFDFNHFTKYLTRGLWPFLVSLVFSVVLVMLIFLLQGVVMTAFALAAGGSEGGEPSPVLLGLVMLAVSAAYVVGIVGFTLLIKPFQIRAELTQEFGAAFDFGFARQFIGLTWVECVVSGLFVVAASVVLACVGLLALCVGIYFISGPLYYMMAHLNKQIYQLHLARGGAEVPRSPALRDGPPPMPA